MRLETARLVLRVPDEQDVDAWATMYAHPKVTRFLGPRSREEIVAHIRTVCERHAADGFGLLAVVRKDDGRVIGRPACSSGIGERGPRRRCETQASTARSRSAGRSLPIAGAAAMRPKTGAACRDYVLEELGRRRVIALIDPGNERSVAVATRLGLEYERDVLQRGERPIRLYALNVQRRE